MSGDIETLSLDAVNDLTGDDILYWLSNPFMTPEMLAEKVCWWVAKASAAHDQAVRAEALAEEFGRRAEVYEAHPEYDTDRYLDGYATGMRVAERVARAAALRAQPAADTTPDTTNG